MLEHNTLQYEYSSNKEGTAIQWKEEHPATDTVGNVIASPVGSFVYTDNRVTGAYIASNQPPRRLTYSLSLDFFALQSNELIGWWPSASTVQKSSL